MAFPTSTDTFSNPQGTTLVATDDHAQQHRVEGSAIVSLENKVGLGAGTPTVNKILVGSGNGTAVWGQTWNAGTLGTAVINNSTLGTPAITGGTINNSKISMYSLGSISYTGTAGGTTTIDLSTATRFLIVMPNSAGSVTLLVSNVLPNQPFLVEILQGTAGLGTIGWFNTIRWPGAVVPTLTSTANKKDTFGLITTSSNTFDGYIVGQNL